MPEERRPSIDQRIQALTMNLELLAKQSEELHEEVATHEREMQRFRRALCSGLQAYRSGIGEN